MVSQRRKNDNNNKGLKIAYLKFCLVFIDLFLTKKISFNYEVFVHNLPSYNICSMFIDIYLLCEI